MKTVKVAVYGTLKSSHSNHSLLGKDAKVLEKGVRVPGYTLYDCGWFPGIKPSEQGEVVVEVVEIPVSVLDRLDAYEGYDSDNLEASLFIRERISLPNGEKAFLYYYNREVTPDMSIIHSGDWSDDQ